MFDGILVSLLSASKVCKEALNVTILTGDFTDLKKDYVPFGEEERSFLSDVLKKSNPDSEVAIKDVTLLIKGELALTVNLDNDYTPYCLIRTFLDLIEGMPDRVLYLDCDTVVMNDLSNFFHSDMDNADIGCVLDNRRIGFFHPTYCNAGVMLLDLTKIRLDGLMVKSRELIATKKMKHPDQDAMNKVFRKAKKIKRYKREYNEQRKLNKTTVIRHFTPMLEMLPYPHWVNGKPWAIDQVHHIYKNDEFDNILKEYISLKKEYALANVRSYKK